MCRITEGFVAISTSLPLMMSMLLQASLDLLKCDCKSQLVAE